jgi:DNA primase
MDQRDISAVKSSVRLSDVVRLQGKTKREGEFLRGLCPLHVEKTPSFWVNDAKGRFGCHGCGQHGDVIDWLMITHSLSFAEAVNELSGGKISDWELRLGKGEYFERVIRPNDDERRIAHAHGLWIKRQNITGTLAERYLNTTRGISGPFPVLLGYVPRAYCSFLEEETEALIAPLMDSRGHVTAVQQIFLCRETLDAWRDDKGKRVKRTLGAMLDASVRLGVPDTVLGLAGSVEDALAASQLYSLPVWATCGEQRMARVWTPPEVERVVVFADADDAGAKAADEARKAHRAAGKIVDIITPQDTKDFAAVAEKRAEVWA